MTSPAPMGPRTGPPVFTLSSSRVDDRHVLSPAGELDVATASGLEAELRRVEASAVETIVLDLSHLTFIEPVGIGLVVRGSQRSLANGGRLTLVAPSPQVLRVFEICGIADRLVFGA
jgi:anti-anti-sigma factor